MRRNNLSTMCGRGAGLLRLIAAAVALPAIAIAGLAGARPGLTAPPELILKGGALCPKPVVKDGQEPATGLQRAFPEPMTRQNNPCTPQRVALGRLLFFDPILSGNNKMACANCHHPDLGFVDGLPRARGFGAVGFGPARHGGPELPRKAPTLWNALYYKRQYWDGRAKDLEDQAQFPITAHDEMGGDRARDVKKLKAIAEYRALFDRAFGGSNGGSITFDHVTDAIADFERTFVCNNSRFDRYAAGDSTAMTTNEKEGLKLFLSTKTRCDECHGLPTFSNSDFKVIGVPNPKFGPRDPHKDNAEPGRGGGPTGAFKIPTLRNVAIRAPYMHNGTFKSLSEVIEFYSKGGGRGRGLKIPHQDDKIRRYSITAQEKKDLIAFLGTLTDVSSLPIFPTRVPSGLPVVRHVRNPALARARAEGVQIASLRVPHISSSSSMVRRGRVVDVRPGQSIQEAVEQAGTGGTVRIHPGTYHESVLAIYHGMTIKGIVENGVYPVMDGKNKFADAIVGMGNRFTIEGLEIRNYQGNGVVVHGTKQVTFRDLRVENPGTYAVYPVSCDGVLVEKCFVRGSKDAGIYVGQSQNIIVRDNEIVDSVAGLEIENCRNALVENNYCHQNTGGILAFVLPFNPSKVCEDVKIVHNRIINNNVDNFADRDAIVRNVLRGTGVMILAADRVEVAYNEIVNNGSFAVSVSNLRNLFDSSVKLDVDPNPDGEWIHDNILRDNAKHPDPRLKSNFRVNAVDVMWDGTGKGNAFDQPGATTIPPKLPRRAPQ